MASKAQVDDMDWARRPASQLAMSAITHSARNGDPRFIDILEQHKRDGICDEHGNLLRRWCGIARDWRSV